MKTEQNTTSYVKELTNTLEEGIAELFESDRYRKYLTTMSKFHHYSINNSILIALQKPEATLVAGYRAWEVKFGRHVKKGEKAIRIFSPMKFQSKEKQEDLSNEIDKPNEESEDTLRVIRTGFRTAGVFDISQTEGKALPSIGVTSLTGTAEGCEELTSELIALSPVPVMFTEITGDANGYFSSEEQLIVVKDSLSEIHRLKTLIHEISHAKLHSNIDELTIDRQTMEVEAESIAYVVSQSFGIDTSEYSFGYIAAWSSGREMKELKMSLETIRITASGMIDELNERLGIKEQIENPTIESETGVVPKQEKNRKISDERAVR
ncbi:MAG: ArdC-like ssDNA-binding domain-containing protein [Anaerofustis sp.]